MRRRQSRTTRRADSANAFALGGEQPPGLAPRMVPSGQSTIAAICRLALSVRGTREARAGRFAARLGAVSNVAIIFLAVIVAAAALRDYAFAPPPVVESPSGAQLALPDVGWNERP